MKRTLTILFAVLTLVLSAQGSAQAGGSAPPPTKYPLILSHGFSGWDKLFGVLDYFYGIPSDLKGQGYKVYVSEVSSFNSIQVRGDQLLKQAENVIAITGKPKVNILGHSMGGLDARYVAHILGSAKVASVTTFATPNRGTVVADVAAIFINDRTGSGLSGAVINALAFIFGSALSGSTALPQDLVAGITNLTTPFVTNWNKTFTNATGVYYQSYGGSSVYNVSLDISDAVLWTTSLLFGFEANDGLVGVNSTGWGTVRNLKLNANHLDEVNQLFGSTGLFGFDAKGFYRGWAGDLQKKGY